jgi:hypothetical protein
MTDVTKTELKADWKTAVDTLATYHFRAGRHMGERRELAERFLKDTLNFQVAHLGKNERVIKSELEREFSNPENIRTAIRKYPGPNIG